VFWKVACEIILFKLIVKVYEMDEIEQPTCGKGLFDQLISKHKNTAAQLDDISKQMAGYKNLPGG
jgi:hypothetical protein